MPTELDDLPAYRTFTRDGRVVPSSYRDLLRSSPMRVGDAESRLSNLGHLGKEVIGQDLHTKAFVEFVGARLSGLAPNEFVVTDGDRLLDTVDAFELFEPFGAVAEHEGAVDPHPQYLTEAEGDARYALSDPVHSLSHAEHKFLMSRYY